MQTHRDVEFADGTYRLQLGMGQILAIEEKCNARIGAIYAHVLSGRYEQDGVSFGYGLQANFGAAEAIEVARQALIGGDYAVVDGREIKVRPIVERLLSTYVYPENGNPLTKMWDLATVALEACVNGYEPPAAEKKSPKRTSRTATAGSTEERSSATAS